MYHTNYDFQLAALDLANAIQPLGKAIRGLSYFHSSDRITAIDTILKHEQALFGCQRKVWMLAEAERIFCLLNDDIYQQILFWLKDKGILVTPSCSRQDVVLTAINAGWTLNPNTPNENVA